ncbi:MAG TPA: AAA family ATPase [Acidimicrobiia bacterium]|nr:AAA family ATPase [Acidimicrobiia bacterium]
MKLKKVRITNYKSIEDSDEFSIGSLTCLAGKNESGKTALLQALRRLNPVEESERAFDHTMEFPRSRLHEADGADQKVLETTWDLDDADVEAVEDLLGTGALASNEIRVSKGYGSSTTSWTVSLDEKSVIRGLASRGDELTAPASERVGRVADTQGLRAMVSQQGERATIGEKRLIELLDEFRDGLPRKAAIDVLRTRLPRLLYFPTYEAMPGRVGVEDLISRQNDPDQVTQEDRIFLALLALAGTTLEEVHDQELSEALIAKLEGVSNFISREIFSYWSQNRHLKVRFDYREALIEDPEDGHVFLTRVENTRHGVTVGFDERSAGFVWFFSFLVWFSQAEREYGEKLVILLDEPGLSLHGTAQGDLLRYIKEKLLPKYQVIYTTHSPFMIDAADLLTVRTVEDVVTKDDRILGTKVGDRVLSTDADTVFPLRAVLGYDLTQSLFVGEHTLLVEGPSDLLYLTWASNELRARERAYLDPRWTVCPTGGIDKIGTFVALFGANALHVAVLTDFHSGDKAKVRSLRESEILRSGHVFSAESYTNTSEADVEDLLGRPLYPALIIETYGLGEEDLPPDSRPDGASERVAKELAEHLRTVDPSLPQFDHYAPAAYLVEHWSDLKRSLPGVDDALERFEAFFTDLNALL